MSFVDTAASTTIQSSNDFLESTDVILLPFPDIDLSDAGRLLRQIVSGTLVRGIRLTSVQQLEFDKGNVLTAHRVDGGYALTQRGGSQDDRAFIRVLLIGPGRFLIKELIQSLAEDKSIPVAMFSREGIFLKAQVESTKIIATVDRRQAIIMHIILRQLRSFEGGFIATVGRLGLATLIPTFFEEDSIYTRVARENLNSGGQSLGLTALGGIANLFS